MSNTSYLSRISKDKETKEKELLLETAQDAKVQIDADLNAAKKELRQAKKAYEAALASVPFDTDNAISAGRDVKSLEEDVAAIEALREELFGDTETAE